MSPKIGGVDVVRLIVAIAVGVGLLIGPMGASPVAAQDSSPPAATSAADCPPVDQAANEAIARRWHEDALGAGDLSVFDEILAADFRHDSATFASPDDLEAFKAIFAELTLAFPDLSYTIDEVISSDDLVAVRWTATGTHEATFQGIEPTGIQVTWPGINLYQFACGEVVASWSEIDSLGRLQQLGVLPAADAAAATAADATVASDAATPVVSCPVTDPSTAEALVLGWWNEVWNGGDLDRLDEILSDRHQHHWALGPDTTGADAVKARLAALHTAFPDLQISAHEIVIDGDLVAGRWVATGTNSGELMGAAPTGATATWQGINIFRLECGRIAEVWSEMDGIGMQEQLGMLPAMATPAP